MCGESLRSGVIEFFEYDTPKIVHIKSKLVGILNRTIQLAIIAYLVGFVIIHKKGYQEFSSIDSSVTAKLKGVAYTNFSNDDLRLVPESHRSMYNHRLWDVADYVVPPQENGAFFVTTNVIITPTQTQGTCPEDPGLAPCNKTADCERGKPVRNGNGVMTGDCDVAARSCIVHAWCPVERDFLPLGKNVSLLADSKHFTVLLKNNVEFPLFGVKRRNVKDNDNATYLERCHYDSVTDPSCPVFTLGAIVRGAGEDYDQLAVEGAVIGITVRWECNLDFDARYCFPAYSFRRLDNPDAQIARGWNFRHAQYYEDDRRTLFKSYGIRFVVFVQGRAGKFNVVPLMLNVGSGLGLMAITTVICDIVALYVVKRRQLYKENKFLKVEENSLNYGEFHNESEG